MYKMRRKDREATDINKIRDILSACHCCRLGFCDEGKPYIVPLNFGYIENDGIFTFYFHGAGTGRKIDLIRKNHYAGFEMDTNFELHEADEACEHSAAFQSIIGGGKVDLVEDQEEKVRGLNAIMGHLTGKADWSYGSAMLDRVCVFKLEVEELSCKEHL